MSHELNKGKGSRVEIQYLSVYFYLLPISLDSFRYIYAQHLTKNLKLKVMAHGAKIWAACGHDTTAANIATWDARIWSNQ